MTEGGVPTSGQSGKPRGLAREDLNPTARQILEVAERLDRVVTVKELIGETGETRLRVQNFIRILAREKFLVRAGRAQYAVPSVGVEAVPSATEVKGYKGIAKGEGKGKVKGERSPRAPRAPKPPPPPPELERPVAPGMEVFQAACKQMGVSSTLGQRAVAAWLGKGSASFVFRTCRTSMAVGATVIRKLEGVDYTAKLTPAWIRDAVSRLESDV